MQGGWQPPGGGGYGGPPHGGAPPGYDMSQGPAQQGFGGPQQGMAAPQPPAPIAQTAPAGFGLSSPQPGYGPPPPGAYGQPPPGFGAPPGMGFAGGFGSYEFNDLENSIIGKTAGRARTWGIISIVLGVLNVLLGFLFFVSPGLLVNLVSGIVSIVVGVTFLGAGNSLRSVVDTQGNDLQHMMQAMEKLASAFTVQIVAAIVGFILGAIAIVLAIFVLAAMAVAH